MKPDLKNDEFFSFLLESGKIDVNKKGKVTNLVTKKEIGSINGGYYRVGMKDFEENRIRLIQVHRLVWLKYKGNIPEDMVINHIDGDKRNNRLSNLEVISYKGNLRHALDKKLLIPKKGEEKVNSKFSDSVVLDLRKKFSTGKYTVKYFSKKFNVNLNSIRNMLCGSTYIHVGGPVETCKKILSSRAFYNPKAYLKMKPKILKLKKRGYSNDKISKKICLSTRMINSVLAD